MRLLTDAKVTSEMEAEGTSYCTEHSPLVLLSLAGLAESCNKETWGRQKRWVPMQKANHMAGFL